ncbi:unnamed protein product [Albugo candida]|nr:unnamed protein product [Albugo candida]|eukprot:CCI50793.1 unnamed protein product [Albugo candida]
MLDQIIAQRRVDIEIAKKTISEKALDAQIVEFDAQYGKPINVLERLQTPIQKESWSKMALASEFKRASPSKGNIALHADVTDYVKAYASAGASMISVLTEPKWFKGSLDDMKMARTCLEDVDTACRPAVLRKDFIIDPYQVKEARAYGADCVLLIVAILTPEELCSLVKVTLSHDMYPLIEINSIQELEIALQAETKLLGINNRNLHTFKLDLNRTMEITETIASRKLTDLTIFVLSGIHSHQDVVMFKNCGAHGILVGESLMKSQDIQKGIENLMSGQSCPGGRKSNQSNRPLAKVCGVTSVEDALVALQAGADLIGIILVKSAKRSVSLEQAKSIVHTVMNYGERQGPILPNLLQQHKVGACSGSIEWFERNAVALRQACSRATLVVGVFANQTTEEINVIVAETGIDLVQLHGDEGFEICREINTPTIRTLHLPAIVHCDSVDSENIMQHIQPGLANYLLLDSVVKGQQGGTGMTFDWNIAARFALQRIPCLMAGGLTPENVVKALALVHPLGVDVSSGVEKEPRKKDEEKIRSFVCLVHDFLTYTATSIQEE